MFGRDPELTAKGKEQARLTGLDIAAKNPVTAVITSPFIRCVQTAAAIAAVNNNAPVYIEDGLSEWLNKKWYAPLIDSRLCLIRSRR